MRCPHCDFENPGASTSCQQCAAPLDVASAPAQQAEYNAPAPPPLNGNAHRQHASIFRRAGGAGPAESASRQPAQASEWPGPAARGGAGLLGGVLYAIGLCIAALGVMETLLVIDAGAQPGTLLAGCALLIAGCVCYLRVFKRAGVLSWWQRLCWLLAASAGAFVALLVGALSHLAPPAIYLLDSGVTIAFGLLWSAIGLL